MKKKAKKKVKKIKRNELKNIKGGRKPEAIHIPDEKSRS